MGEDTLYARLSQAIAALTPPANGHPRHAGFDQERARHLRTLARLLRRHAPMLTSVDDDEWRCLDCSTNGWPCADVSIVMEGLREMGGWE